jgi:hypothetical protein
MQNGWKDIYSTYPPDGQILMARRHTPDLGPVYGTWNATAHGLLAGPLGSAWFVPDLMLWAWHPVSALPAWPVPSAKDGWQDVWESPPADGQNLYVRRLGFFTAAVVATFDAATAQFTADTPGASVLPWFYVWKWKPRPSYVG